MALRVETGSLAPPPGKRVGGFPVRLPAKPWKTRGFKLRAMSTVLGVLAQRRQKAYSSFHTAVRGNKWLQLEVNMCHRADVLLGKLRPREKNASGSVLRAGPHHPGQRPPLLVQRPQSTEKGHNDIAALVPCGKATLLRRASDRSQHCAEAP